MQPQQPVHSPLLTPRTSKNPDGAHLLDEHAWWMRGIAERGVMGTLLQMENVRAVRSAVSASIATENMLWARVNFGPIGPNVFGMLVFSQTKIGLLQLPLFTRYRVTRTE
ncbi:hypothetical protein ES288_D06G126000v1 [Gossypium darwinii]|uniref:Uncharacterized protein n=1 Tax=Gossypium darwinii TaxID=34276 RepID=A0A5D2C7J2_GOSDA|nr:hypothetical protein ES288_D06G126000v1 [Gossypium darwinii]